MMRLTRTAIGLLTAQYRSVLRKCFLINVGLYALLAPAASLTTATAVAVTAMPNVAQADYPVHNVPAGTTVDKIDDAFTNNTITNVEGAYVNNSGTINYIDAVVSGNTVNASSITTEAMIVNANTIRNIFGTYSNNSATVSGGNDESITIYNNGGTIDTINALFYKNNINGYNSPEGAAVLNALGTINHIYGSFIGNYIVSANAGAIYGVTGGAISNYNSNAHIGDINALFIGNYVKNTGTTQAKGGAISSADDGSKSIDSINGIFIGNYAQANSGVAQGGAVYNDTDSTIGSIGAANDKALFIGNYAQSTSGEAHGGAIFNDGTINNIYADFIGNSASTHGGAFYGNASSVEGNFINNQADNSGGAMMVFRDYNVEKIKGKFIGNKATGGSGGAIYHYNGHISSLEADFISNNAAEYGGAVFNPYGSIDILKGNFINNTSGKNAGALENSGRNGNKIGSIIGNFIGNSVSSSGDVQGGAIFNEVSDDNAVITSITADFINNLATSTSGLARGGAIYNTGTIGNVTGEFKGNKTTGASSTYEAGGAIYNTGTINITNSVFNANSANAYSIIRNTGLMTLTDTSVYNSSQYDAAIRSSGENSKIYINAVNKDVMFTGNKNGTAGYADFALFSNSNASGYFNAKSGKKIVFNGQIWGQDHPSDTTLHINSDSTNNGGEYIFNNQTGAEGIEQLNLKLYNNANVRFGNVRQQDGNATYGKYEMGSTTVDSTGASMNFANANADQTQNFGALTLNGNLKLGLDSGEKIAASSATGEGSILFDYINYASTPAGNQISWTYADSGNAVIGKVADNSTATVNTPYTTYKGSVVKNATNNNQIDVTLSNGAENLAGFLVKDETGTSYDMSRDEQILVDLDEGGRTMAGTTKTVNANGHNIIGNQHSGVTLADGQTLTINDANVEGFYKKDANGAVVNKGTVNINNSTFRNNVTQYTGADTVYGGAIYSSSNIVDSSFYNNSVIGAIDGSNVQGGAIYKQANVYARTKDSIFEGNYSSGNAGAAFMTESSSFTGQNGHKVIFSNNSAAQRGGALLTYGSSTNTVSNAEFLYNSAGTIGGAILNDATLNISDTLFKGNDANTGGAIQNEVTLSVSNSTFENNTATSQGGAIYNAGTIGEFDADEKPVEGKGIINTTFKGNMANYDAGTTYGGAIYNTGKIANLEANFTENTAMSTHGYAYGGAIYNAIDAEIGNIKGDFTGNYLYINQQHVTAAENYGAAIYNAGKITSISGNFKENWASNGSQALGTIINLGTIDSIDSNFTSNRLMGNVQSAGSAISNRSGKITNITGRFENNMSYTTNDVENTSYIKNNRDYYSRGAIENYATIDTINADFVENSAHDDLTYTEGGAIWNSGSITSISGNFTNNYVMSNESYAQGGAIYNDESKNIGSIGTADNHAKFEGNYAQANTGDALGGAIFNTGVIDNIYADFTNNKTESVSGNANGGAIYNTGTIKNVTGRFEDNSYLAETNEVNGGAVWNQGKIKVTDSIFSNNKGRAGGAFMNMNGGLVIIKNSQFIDNSALYGGALYNNGGDSIMHIENSTIKNNKSGSKNSFMEASGQLIIANSEIYNNSGLGGTLEVGNGGRVGETNLKTTLIDTNFTNNSGTSYAAIAISGAYESKPTVNIIANLEDVLFRNNAYNAGYIDILSSTESTNQINLNASTGKSIDFGGMITGTGTLNINKSGLTYTDLKDDGTFDTETKNITQTGGDYIFRNEVSGQTMNLYDGANVQLRNLRQADGTTSYGKVYLTGMTVTGAGNILDTRNGILETTAGAPITQQSAAPYLGNLTLNNDLIWRLDVDLSQSGIGNDSDYLDYSSVSGSGKIVIDAINLATNSGTQTQAFVMRSTTPVKTQTGGELAAGYHTFTPDYKDKYTVKWSTDGARGLLNFTDNGTTNLNLVGFLSNQDAASLTEYNMATDEPVLRNIGDMTGTTKTVNAQDAQGNNYTINGNGFSGVTVGDGKTLNINGGVWDGFVSDAATRGSVMRAYSGTLKIDGATFKDNTTQYFGGALNANQTGIIEIKNSTFTNNKAIEYSGGAFFGDAGSITTVKNSTFDNNTTHDGGGAISSEGVTYIEDTSFNNNQAATGGAIHFRNADATLTNTVDAKTKDILFSNNTGTTYAGAILNTSVTTISATGGDVIFKNNEAGTEGGAIYNAGTLDISGENGHKVVFEGNSSVNTHSRSWGGAIYNASGGHITNIDADFIGNYADAQGGDRLSGGGAILNLGSNESETNIDSIRGTFKNNYLLGEHGRGAAIGNYSNGTIGDIEGIFTGNYVEVSQGIGGGAIWTEHGSTINFIKGEFENNHVYSKGSQGQVSRADSAAGGAISNSGWQEGSTNTIGSIDGSFRNNYAKSESIRAMGGAISNLAHLYLTPEISMISSITSIGSSSEKATFENNYAESVGLNAYGGGIANDFGKIGSINADFTGNYAKSTGEFAEGAGGMVISGDTTDKVGSGRAYGGAIFNLAQVTKDDSGNITGVVENTGVIDSISGNFTDNYVYSENGPAAGAAIYNEYGTIGQIGSADNKALFEGNKIHNIGTGFSMAGATGGGTIYNVKGTIGDIYADFTNNFGKASDITAGTALSNFDGSVGNIVGNFTDNEMENSENGHGTLNNRAFSSVASITSIVGNFINNSIKTNKDGYGGAIMNYKITGDAANIAHIGTIEGTFENNGVTAERYVKGGAIANLDNDASAITAIIDSITGTFRNNYVIATGTNFVEAHGAAIYNTDQISNIQDSTFEGNYIIAPHGKAMGGAIWNSGSINLSALQSDVNFWNNKANDRYNDIYNSGTMNFNAAQNKTMSFGGSIEGTGAININTSATSGGTYVFKSGVSAGDVVVGSAASNYAPATLSFEKAKQEDGSITNGTFDVDSLTINGDGNSLSTRNDKVDTNSATTLTLNNALNLQIDGDLQSGKGDSLAVTNLTAAAPKSLRLTAMNFTADPDVTTLSKTDTIDVDISDGEIASLDGAYTLASTNPDDTTEEQIEQTYLNNLTSSSGNYNRTYAFRSAKLMTKSGGGSYVQYGDAITLKWLYENYINGWSGGNYILKNVVDGGTADATHLTVGQALTALDSALGQNATYDFGTESVADVLVNNYYTKLMKKDEKFDTNEGIMDVKSLKKDTNSSQGRIIKGVSAFPSNLCAYPFDMPQAANDNHKSVIVRSAKHDVTIFGRQSDNTATTSKQAA